jgi:hypothetical protein
MMGRESSPTTFNYVWECAGKAEGVWRVKVSHGQSRSRQAGTESCGRHGNVGSEA